MDTGPFSHASTKGSLSVPTDHLGVAGNVGTNGLNVGGNAGTSGLNVAGNVGTSGLDVSGNVTGTASINVSVNSVSANELHIVQHYGYAIHKEVLCILQSQKLETLSG